MVTAPTSATVSSQPYPSSWSVKLRQLVRCIDPAATDSVVCRAVGTMHGLWVESKLREGHAGSPVKLAHQALEIARGYGQGRADT